MDVSPTTTPSMQPPGATQILKSSKTGQSSKKAGVSSSGASASIHNPKVVQTAFVHKLYNMLEDQSIQHLIQWSPSNESFLMSPSTEFSKVLAAYFKHTNVSSFVRQLNMYGFHKVSDVFHNGSPETPLWEFKHGGGSFKKGDLDSLRDIKRRASRHTLIHRDSFSTGAKQSTPQQAPLADAPTDSVEGRMNMLEQSLFDLHTRLTRSEEHNALVSARCQDLTEKLTKSYQHNQELAGNLATFVEDPQHPVRRSISHMQHDIQRQLNSLRNPYTASSPSTQLHLHRPFDSHPTSPASLAYDDRRRASIQVLPSQTYARPLAPSPMRHGSIGTARSSPGTGRLGRPPPPAFPHPTSPPPPNLQSQIPAVAVEPPPYLPRRHTSADIHSTSEWLPHHDSQQESREPALPNPFSSAYSSGNSSIPTNGKDQQLRDKLNSYSFASTKTANARGREHSSVSQQPSRGSSPPPSYLAPPPGSEASWSQPPPVRMVFRDVFKNNGLSSPGSSGAPSRRSSMANIHNMLNPTDTAEAEGEEEQRKRKRRG